GEGFELVDTIMFSQGRWPYQDTDVYPFYSSNYPPLFHVIAAPFVWLFGPAYWYGRLLGFISTLITAGAIALAVYRDGRHRWLAVLSGLAFLASNTVYHIGPLFRQHMTMVMFEMLAVVVLAHANEIPERDKRRWRIVIGLGLLIAAGYTKQLAAASAVAALIFLFIRQPRRAVISGLAFITVGAGIFLWMNSATQGQWWLQTIAANVNPFYPDQAVGLFRLWFGLHGFLIVPAVLYVLYELYFSRLSIYSIWWLASIANSILSGKWGAGDSYFATAIAATCVLSGLFAARTLRREWVFPDNYLSRVLIRPLRWLSPGLSTAGLILIPLLYLGYGRAVLHLPTDGPVFGPIAGLLGLQANALNDFYDSAGRIAGGYADIGHLTTSEDIANGWRIVAAVRAAPGPVLSEEAAFTLLAGKEVITNPTQLLNLWLNGGWDPTALVNLIENRAFGLIVLRAQFYPEPVLLAIAGHYEHRETIPMNGFDYLLLYPRAGSNSSLIAQAEGVAAALGRVDH
ncbi:MAG: glycosyltransferase family 39 protein, partial [Anaerolinea sp.]|nr:glycosyltransferase family 39 protein [Anaerolinea sp.]